jgi:WD40 repeat protein
LTSLFGLQAMMQPSRFGIIRYDDDDDGDGERGTEREREREREGFDVADLALLLQTRECIRTCSNHTSKVYGVAKVASSVWSFSWDRTIQVWNATTHAHHHSLARTFHDDAVTGIVAHRHARLDCWQVITCSLDRAIVAWLVNEPNQ